MAENALPVTDWNPRLRCRVGSADVGRAHRLLMGGALIFCRPTMCIFSIETP